MEACQLVKHFSKYAKDACTLVCFLPAKHVTKRGTSGKDGEVRLKRNPDTVEVYTDEDVLAAILETEEPDKHPLSAPSSPKNSRTSSPRSPSSSASSSSSSSRSPRGNRRKR